VKGDEAQNEEKVENDWKVFSCDYIMDDKDIKKIKLARMKKNTEDLQKYKNKDKTMEQIHDTIRDMKKDIFGKHNDEDQSVDEQPEVILPKKRKKREEDLKDPQNDNEEDSVSENEDQSEHESEGEMGEESESEGEDENKEIDGNLSDKDEEFLRFESASDSEHKEEKDKTQLKKPVIKNKKAANEDSSSSDGISDSDDAEDNTGFIDPDSLNTYRKTKKERTLEQRTTEKEKFKHIHKQSGGGSTNIDKLKYFPFTINF
jgi:hypothetical protein